jgi:hypothetical protein
MNKTNRADKAIDVRNVVRESVRIYTDVPETDQTNTGHIVRDCKEILKSYIEVVPITFEINDDKAKLTISGRQIEVVTTNEDWLFKAIRTFDSRPWFFVQHLNGLQLPSYKIRNLMFLKDGKIICSRNLLITSDRESSKKNYGRKPQYKVPMIDQLLRTLNVLGLNKTRLNVIPEQMKSRDHGQFILIDSRDLTENTPRYRYSNNRNDNHSGNRNRR